MLALAVRLRPVASCRLAGVFVHELRRVADVEVVFLVTFLPASLVRVGEVAAETVAGHAADALQFELLQAVEGSFEIVQDDRVGETLEDECKFPEGVDAVGQAGAFDHVGDSKDVDDDKSDADQHGDKQDREARRDAHELDVAEFIARFDVVEEGEDCEDPPWVAE
jgi:hypothetical protein